MLKGLKDFEKQFSEVTEKLQYDYYNNGSDDNVTREDNLLAFQRYGSMSGIYTLRKEESSSSR